jgi:hypothetical protein
LATDVVDSEVALDEEEAAVRVVTASVERVAAASELVPVAGLVSASAGSGHGNCIAAAATAPRAASDDDGFGGGTPKAAADELGGCGAAWGRGSEGSCDARTLK